ASSTLHVTKVSLTMLPLSRTSWQPFCPMVINGYHGNTRSHQETSMDRVTQPVLLTELLPWAAQSYGNTEGMLTPDEFTGYADLHERACALAGFLKSEGVQQGEHVGILLQNSPEFLQALFAVSNLGAIPVTLNTRFGSHELTYAVK